MAGSERGSEEAKNSLTKGWQGSGISWQICNVWKNGGTKGNWGIIFRGLCTFPIPPFDKVKVQSITMVLFGN